MKVLCAGDLHIGRRSSKVPEGQAGERHSCAAAWGAIVDTAILEGVDVVALSGDLVDRANRYFEAIGPLERGLRRLAGAGIDIFAVAGNHDYDVLPQLVDTLRSERFHFLGRGGEWERQTVYRDGRAALHVDGWSFPRQDVIESPLGDYPFSQDDIPAIGLLHADLGQANSRYGPVTLDAFQREPVAAWILGHIHRPAIMEQAGEPLVLYPGSPQAMDPGEAGSHGIVILDLNEAGLAGYRQVPISTVCYRTLSLDLTGVNDDEDVRERVVGALRDALTDEEHQYDLLECLCCRVTLVGRTSLHSKLPDILAEAEEDLQLTGVNGVQAFVETFEFQTRPAVDLQTLASRNDPPGELARFIQSIEAGDPPTAYRDLIAGTVQRLRDIHGSTAFKDISADPEPDEMDARRYLLEEAWMLLDTLLAQKEAA